MASLLVINARLITVAAGADDLGYLDEGWMLVEDGIIAATGAGQPPAGTTADETLDVAGAFEGLRLVGRALKRLEDAGGVVPVDAHGRDVLAHARRPLADADVARVEHLAALLAPAPPCNPRSGIVGAERVGTEQARHHAPELPVRRLRVLFFAHGLGDLLPAHVAAFPELLDHVRRILSCERLRSLRCRRRRLGHVDDGF